MASAFITARTTSRGEKRYVVRYRLGGRETPVAHAGSFTTMKDARARRDFVVGEIAANRNPAIALDALITATVSTVTTRDWTTRFLASRLDIDDNTKKNYRSILTKIADRFGTTDPANITVDDIASWIHDLAQNLKPGTVQLHLVVARMLFDYIGIDNPARDPRIKLPKRVREEPKPPPADHVEAILTAMTVKFRLMFVVIEQGALRLGEAVHLTWGDVDIANLRLRLPRSATKRDQARWVYLPEWLIDLIDATCPLEDRVPERRVFQSITEASAYQAMTRACRNAKVPHYHPHDLRHRRITVWHQSGVPARELAERAGHSKPSMSLDVYSHILPADEVPETTFVDLLQ